MTDEPQDAPRPQVGSLAEEAAAFFAALSEFARDHKDQYAEQATAAATSAHEAFRNINDHIATDSVECKFCPVCQVVHAVRATSPEVRQHLATAIGSLAQAAAGMLITPATSTATEPVQKIDLDDEEGWDE